MPYNNAIPQPTDRLSDSQNDILVNFAGLETWAAINHSSIGAAAGTLGQHTFLTLFPQGVAPAGNLILANNVNLYVDNANEPQLKRGANTPVPWLNTQLNPTPGWSYLPSGLVMKWNTTTDATAGAATLNFNTFGPTFVNPNGLFALWFTINTDGFNTDPNKFVNVVNLSNPNAVDLFYTNRTTAGASVGTTRFTWVAIGRT